MSSAPWHLLDSGPCDHAFNMALDEALLEAMPRLGQPVLRFYAWTEPAASFGYFQKYAEVERLTPLRPLVRRPTAGGLVPHDADWTYSLAFPVNHEWYSLPARESYLRVHQWIRAAFAGFGVAAELAALARRAGAGECFAGYEQSDVLCGGRKIAGAAQRRRRDGLLIQGSIQPLPSFPPRTAWQEAMCEVARTEFGAYWTEFVPDVTLQARATELARRKYSNRSWTQKR
jgi:lipoate-protein ligase A